MHVKPEGLVIPQEIKKSTQCIFTRPENQTIELVTAESIQCLRLSSEGIRIVPVREHETKCIFV